MASPTITHSDLGHNNTTGATSLVVNVGFAVPQKDTVVLGIQHNSGQSISTVVDSQGNVYTKQTTPSVGGSGQAGLDIWIARIKYPLTASDTITITPSASSSMAAQAIHVAGACTTNAAPSATLYDVTKTGTGAATNSPTTGASGTLAVADELSLGFAAFTGNTTGFSADSTGYTTQQTVGNANGSLHYGSKAIAVVSPAGTETYAPTLTGSPTNSSVSLITLRGSTLRYVNVSTGNDANSGITAFANAKLTIAACGALTGDVVHVAKTPTPTASAGTSTWTSGSTTVSTTSDLTASIAAKDLVSTTADGSGGWWEVSSITATTITLVTAYRPGGSGLTGAGLSLFALTSAGGGYIGFNTAGNIQASPTNGGTQNDPVQVIGGVNTSNDTRDGFTWMVNTNATRQGIYNTGQQYTNTSYIGVGRTARGFSDTGGGSTGAEYDHCQVASSNGECFYTLASAATYLSNCVGQSQNGSDIFTHAAGANGNATYDTCTALSTTGNGFNDGNGTHQVYKNCNADGVNIGFSLGSQAHFLYNCTSNHSSVGYRVGTTAAGDTRFSGCVSSNASTCDFQGNTNVDSMYSYWFNCLGNSGTPVQRNAGTMMFDKYQQTNGDYRNYSPYGTILSNTANARSGTCVELQSGQGLNISGSSTGISTNSDFATKVNKILEQTWPIPVEAGVTRTVTVYLKKSSTWNGLGVLLGIMANGFWVNGNYPTNIAVSGTVLTTSYQQYTFTFDNTAGVDQVIELGVWLDGSAGSVFVDDIAWS